MWFKNHHIPDLDKKGLQRFGLVLGTIVPGLLGLLFPWILDASFPVWPWIVGGGLVIWAMVAPGTLNPVYRTWMIFGLMMNQVTTPILLGTVFLFVVTPLGLLLRLRGHDPLARKFDNTISSYRVPSRKPPKTNLEKPF